MPDLSKMPVCYRSMEITEQRADGEDDGSFNIPISSETVVERWYGNEILDHTPAAVDMSRLIGLPMLDSHDTTKHIGAADEGSLTTDRTLRVKGRWSKSDAAQVIRQDVKDKIRRFVSVGYRVKEMKLESSADGVDTYRITRWQPLEFSVVSVPADTSVGFGRAEGMDMNEVTLIEMAQGAEHNTRGSIMTVETTTPLPGANPDDAVRKLAAEIVTVAQAYGMPEKAADWIGRGLTVDQVSREILLARAAQPISTPAPEMVKLTEKEQRQYSLVKAIREFADTRNISGFEKEIHDEVSRQLPPGLERRGGFLVPMSIRAGLDSKTATAGAELKFTEKGDFIEMLRNMSVCQRLGAQILTGLVGPVSFPKQATAGVAHWMAENPVAAVTQNDLTLTSVGLAQKTLMSKTVFSRQLVQQSSWDVDQMVRRDLAAVHALEVDRSALHGSGSNNEPSGVYITTGVNSHAVGGVPDWTDIINMIVEVLKDNALAGSLAWATTPSLAGVLARTLVASAAGSSMIWDGKLTDGMIAGYPAMCSNQVSSTLGAGAEHGIVFADWSQMLIAAWGALEIVADPLTLLDTAMIRVVSFQMSDIAIKHPESFCKGTGATIS